MTILNTTIAQNTANRGGAGIEVGQGGGSVVLINSTISDNAGGGTILQGGGISILGSSAIVTLINTILSGNRTGGTKPDCSVLPGTLISFGNNLVGDTNGCGDVTLISSDQIGNSGFVAPYQDDGFPGNAHLPLMSGGQADNKGSDAVCPRIDQLGRNRNGSCDIGAIAQ